MYLAYLEAFQTLDPRAVLPYYHVPSVLLSSRGVSVMAAATDVEAVFATMMDGLQARGYAGSKITDQRVKLLSDTIAMVSGRGMRYRSGGQELERLSATYTLRRTDGGWKIVMTTVHDPDVIVELG
jgi:ketosteroid isomerase-like protein